MNTIVVSTRIKPTTLASFARLVHEKGLLETQSLSKLLSFVLDAAVRGIEPEFVVQNEVEALVVLQRYGLSTAQTRTAVPAADSFCVQADFDSAKRDELAEQLDATDIQAILQQLNEGGTE